MIKNGLLAILICFGFQAIGQTINKTIIDPQLNKPVMIGYCNLTGLEKGEFGEIFKTEFEKYKPKKKYIERLTPVIDKIEFTVVLGTWCGDSKEQVPHFYKILKACNYSDKRVKAIGVDRSKTAIIVKIDDLNIERVPTFILYKNGIEIGRIVETPDKNLERDLWTIISEHSQPEK